MKFYVIKPDDTLQRLAARYYGDWTVWMVLWDYNNHVLTDRFNLDVGVKIAIPDIITSEQTHRVSEGETYEWISKQYYNSEHFAERIKEYNDRVLLSSKIGELINIPALVDKKKYEAVN